VLKTRGPGSGRLEPPTKVCHLQPGDSFGDMALVNSAPRAATVKAITHCILYKLKKAAFQRLIGAKARLPGKDKAGTVSSAIYTEQTQCSSLKSRVEPVTVPSANPHCKTPLHRHFLRTFTKHGGYGMKLRTVMPLEV